MKLTAVGVRVPGEINPITVDSPKVPVKNVKITRICRNKIKGYEKSYECVSCNCHLHLTPESTALSNVALNGIRESGRKVMMLCNTCVDNNERDSFIRSKTVAKVDKLKIGEKLQQMEAKLTKLVDKKVVKALKMTQDKV